MVHLREVGRPEAQAQPELGQIVMELALRRMKGLRAFRSPGLQPQVDAVLFCKLPQQNFIVVVQGVEMADHQHCRRIPYRDFDLRQTGLDGKRFDQRSQRRNEIADLLGENVALAHVGDVAGALLAEPDHRAAFLGHVPRSQARPAPVVPVLAVDDRQHGFGLHLADARQILLQPALLRRHLGARIGVLQAAAAADAEVGAARGLAAGSRMVDLRDPPDFEGRFFS